MSPKNRSQPTLGVVMSSAAAVLLGLGSLATIPAVAADVNDDDDAASVGPTMPSCLTYSGTFDTEPGGTVLRSPRLRRVAQLNERWVTVVERRNEAGDVFEYLSLPSPVDDPHREDALERLNGALETARRSVAAAIPDYRSAPVRVRTLELPIDGAAMSSLGGSDTPVVAIDAGTVMGPSATLVASLGHQLAHLHASAEWPSAPADWVEAYVTWITIAAFGGSDSEWSAISSRLATLRRGLSASPDADTGIAAGGAAWLAYLAEAVGPHAVPATLEALSSRTEPSGEALVRAAERASQRLFSDLLREFHVWTVLVGRRDDGRHFPFASRLDDPPLAADVDWLPAIAVESDPPIGPLGLATLRLRAGVDSGGVTVRFDGALDGRFGVDLLFADAHGALRLVPMPLDASGRGSVTVPATGDHEILLLVRNEAVESSAPLRYTWAAHHDASFPFEIEEVTFAVRRGPDDRTTVDLSWETRSEHGLLGFNLLRTPARGGRTVRVNPVWVPAIGERGRIVGYRYLDTGIRNGTAYDYVIEGVTTEGLSSRSRPIRVTIPASD